MQIHILAIGRINNTPEAVLYQTYLERIEAVGRSLGWRGCQLVELRPQKNTDAAQDSARLKAEIKTRKDAHIIALDSRGRDFDSARLAKQIEAIQMRSISQLIFVLGGADGLTQSFIDEADMTLSFGKMTWPHLLARIMLVEQLWRCVSILSNHPYHRE